MQYKVNMPIKKTLDFIKFHPVVIMFFVFFAIYLTFGFYVTYFSKKLFLYRYDLIYSIDSGKTYAWYYLNSGYPTAKHLLSYLILEPLVSIIKGFTNNPKLTVILLMSFFQGCTVVLIYNTLSKLLNKNVISLLFGILFGFSYTAMLFAILPDIYIWVGFFQALLLYYVVSVIENNIDKLKLKNILVISVLTAFCFGINMINIVSSIFLIIFLLIKIHGKNKPAIIKDFTKIAFTTTITIIILLGMQTFAYNQYNYNMGEAHCDFHIKSEKFANMAKGTFVSPIYALQASKSQETYKIKKTLDLKKRKTHRFLEQKTQPPIIYIPILLFLLLPLIYYGKNYIEYSHKHYINLLLSIVCIYAIFNFFFSNEDCSLFALNYFPFFVIALGLIYAKITPKISYTLLLLFLSYIIFQNTYYLLKIQIFLHRTTEQVHSLLLCATYALAIIIPFGLLLKVLKKTFYDVILINFENQYFSYLIMYLMLILIYGIVNAFKVYVV